MLRFAILASFSCSIGLLQAAPPAPVTSLAYRPNGALLAVGDRASVVTINSDGATVSRFEAHGKVTALAWSRDGSTLAFAKSSPGKSGEIGFGKIDDTGSLSAVSSIIAHGDAIHALTYSSDGKLLASGGYDRLVKFWDAATGKLVRELKDHSDSVYDLAFRPDGKLLATAAADRTVKIWDLDSGRCLYTLSDSTDWVYAVAFSPDGKRLAAAGIDKSIRVWDVDDREGKLVKSAFAHEKAVLKLAYTADGKTLFSVGEDHIVKSWDADTLTERKVYHAQPESILSFTLRADGKQFALGRYDGALLLIDVDTGKSVAQPLPEKPKPPKVGKITPSSAAIGNEVAVKIEGEHIATILSMSSTPAGVTFVDGRLRIAADAVPGVYQLKFKTAGGESNAVAFHVDRFDARPEPAGTDSPKSAPIVTFNSALAGSLARAGEVDHYRIALKAGEELGVQALASSGSKIEPVLALENAAGSLLAESANGSLGYIAKEAGDYVLAIRDRDYRGGGEFTYRLQIGQIPIVTSYTPLGIPRGASLTANVRGVFIGGEQSVAVKAPADAAIGSKIAVPVPSKFGSVLNAPSLVVGEFPQSEHGEPLAVPGSGRGAIHQPGVSQTWSFSAKKSQPLIIEVEARRLGSQLDSVIEVLDASDKPVPLAVLRSIAKTVVVFRDHDSASPGIRMETWADFYMDDYVLVGNELMRIKALPKNPDDDCQFYTINGQRVGHLGTTPSHHAQGTPMFRVTRHPPGTTFPPNGMPLVTLMYRNDDGGAGYGKDSRLRFDPPADGTYRVRVSDARGAGGESYAYRITVRPPRPDFAVRFNPTAPAVWRGGALPINVTVDRKDDFDGPIQVRLDNLPAGFSAPPTFIEAGQLTTTFALFAEPGAKGPDAKAPPIKLIASAVIDGKDVMHEAMGGAVSVVDPGDIVTTTSQQTIAIKPGQETRFVVHVERRNGFKGRIPLEVQGLPHGVRVLHIGLNGILVTERDTSREVFLYSEPWVKPMEHPIVVLAKREGKNSEHAAKSVLLKIEK